MAEKIYRHFGKDLSEFDISKFNEIHDRGDWNKPWGGFWASDIESKYPWEVWCRNQEFDLKSLNKHFDFKIKDDARILRFTDVEQTKKLLETDPFLKRCHRWINLRNCYLDWDAEKLLGHTIEVPILYFSGLAEKYDAIEINAGSDPMLYLYFYGWDCDSIVIMNKDIIII